MEITLEHTAEVLAAHDNIVITAHIRPDGDSLGSMLALAAYLKATGKCVQLLLDDDIPDWYGFLPGIEQIVKPNGRSMKADLLVVVDASDLERIGKIRAIVDAPILNIDHHISNTKFAEYLFLDSRAAATGEIIFDLFKVSNIAIDAEIATNLYTAIATDCGFFQYANTSSRTLKCCAELIDCGIKPHVIAEQLETKPLSTIASLAKVLETLDLFHYGKIATITVAADLLSDNESTEGFINYPRIIEGVEVAVMFKSADDNAWRISLRSKRVNVSKIALQFGGGGHARAAGCSVVGCLHEVKAQMVTAITTELRTIEND